MIFEEVLEEDDGVSVNGVTVNYIRHADNSWIVVDSQAELQNMITNLVIRNNKFGFTINSSKTNVMFLSKKPAKISIKLIGEEVEQVSMIKSL